MTNWASTNVKSLIELTGAIAVLLGLIFVGLELRQNTAAVEASTLQSLTDASVDYVTLLATDADLSRIWVKASTDSGQLTDEEATRLQFLIRGQWLRFQNAFLHWQRGTLNDEDWALYEGFICRVSTPGGDVNQGSDNIRVTTWGAHKPVLLGAFAEFVEQCRANYTAAE
jgi:hypothetical protein